MKKTKLALVWRLILLVLSLSCCPWWTKAWTNSEEFSDHLKLSLSEGYSNEEKSFLRTFIHEVEFENHENKFLVKFELLMSLLKDRPHHLEILFQTLTQYRTHSSTHPYERSLWLLGRSALLYKGPSEQELRTYVLKSMNYLVRMVQNQTYPIGLRFRAILSLSELIIAYQTNKGWDQSYLVKVLEPLRELRFAHLIARNEARALSGGVMALFLIVASTLENDHELSRLFFELKEHFKITFHENEARFIYALKIGLSFLARIKAVTDQEVQANFLSWLVNSQFRFPNKQSKSITWIRNYYQDILNTFLAIGLKKNKDAPYSPEAQTRRIPKDDQVKGTCLSEIPYFLFSKVLESERSSSPLSPFPSSHEVGLHQRLGTWQLFPFSEEAQFRSEYYSLGLRERYRLFRLRGR